MPETWTVGEPANGNWSGIMAASDLSIVQSAMTDGIIHLKENPTQVSENIKKPVFESDTINGVNIRMTPCAQPGKPLPTVRKLTLRIEHIRKKDYRALQLLYIYDVFCAIQSSNFDFTTGRQFIVKIDDFNLEWAPVRFGEQVYNINMTCRVSQTFN